MSLQFFAWPIFRLFHLTFVFRNDKEVASSLHKVPLEPFSPLVFKYAINRNLFGDLCLWCEGRFSEIDPPTVASAALTYAPSINLKLASLNHLTLASYWRSQPLACRLRAIRPTLAGYVSKFSKLNQRIQ